MARKPRQTKSTARRKAAGVADNKSTSPSPASEVSETAAGNNPPTPQSRKAVKSTDGRNSSSASGWLGWLADSRRRVAVCLITLTVLGFVAYSNSYDGVWLLDDKVSILRNTAARPDATFDRLMIESRPVTTLTFGWNFGISGENPWGYHFTNILFHVLCAFALFALGRTTLRLPFFEGRYQDSADWISLGAASLFVLHPAQTGAVTYIVQRSETLAAIWLVLGLLAGARFREKRDWLSGSLALLATGILGVYSKETGIVLPALFLVYDVCFLSRGDLAELRGRWRLYAALLVVFLSGLTWTAGTLEVGARAAEGGSAGFQVEGLSPLAYLTHQIPTVGYYFRQAFFPDATCFDCGYYGSWPVVNSAFGASLPIWGGFLAALVGSAFLAWRRFPMWTFAILGTGIVLSPSSSIVALTDFYVQHRMYLGVGFLALATVLAIYEASRWAVGRSILPERAANGLCVAILAVVCSIFTVQTLERNALFSNPEALWKDTLAIAPQNRRVRYTLGNLYRLEQRYSEALEQYRAAVELKHDVAKVHVNIGVTLHAMGRSEEANDAYREAFRIDPKFKTAQRNLIKALLRSGHNAEAETVARAAAAQYPEASGYETQLGETLVKLGKPSEALVAYLEAYDRGDHSPESMKWIRDLGGTVPGR